MTDINFETDRKRKPIFLIVLLLPAMIVGCSSNLGPSILDKAAKAMDKTKNYRVRVVTESNGYQDEQLKEISGHDLHWRSQTSGEEQYYIDGVLYTRDPKVGWRTEKVKWERAWKKVNKLDKAENIKMARKEKVDGRECFVITYTLPFASEKTAEKLKATDYINAKTFRYVKAVGVAKGYKSTSIFYDYGKKISISVPQ